jgi:hypothetical protein
MIRPSTRIEVPCRSPSGKSATSSRRNFRGYDKCQKKIVLKNTFSSLSTFFARYTLLEEGVIVPWIAPHAPRPCRSRIPCGSVTSFHSKIFEGAGGVDRETKSQWPQSSQSSGERSAVRLRFRSSRPLGISKVNSSDKD